MRVNTRYLNSTRGTSLCTLYLHVWQVRVTVGDSGLCCCTCVTSLKDELPCHRSQSETWTTDSSECQGRICNSYRSIVGRIVVRIQSRPDSQVTSHSKTWTTDSSEIELKIRPETFSSQNILVKPHCPSLVSVYSVCACVRACVSEWGYVGVCVCGIEWLSVWVWMSEWVNEWVSDCITFIAAS